MKKGFTLVELLATIIILSIITTISVPIIGNVVKDSKKKAGLSEANLIYNEIYKYCETKDFEDENDKICTNSMTIDDINKIIKLGDVNIEKMEFYDDKLSDLRLQINGFNYFLIGNKMELTDNFISKSFAEDSWSTIAYMVKTNNTYNYNIGDTKEIKLNGYKNGAKDTFTVRLANKSTSYQCSEKTFSQTACGFVIEFVDIINNQPINNINQNNGGFEKMSINNFLNHDSNSIYNALPKELKDVIIPTTIVSSHGDADTDNFYFTDKLYLISLVELWGNSYSTQSMGQYDTSYNLSRQLDYYESYNNYSGVSLSNKGGAIKKYQNTPEEWFVRSFSSRYNDDMFVASNTGDCFISDIVTPYGISPAFRIG